MFYFVFKAMEHLPDGDEEDKRRAASRDLMRNKHSFFGSSQPRLRKTRSSADLGLFQRKANEVVKKRFKEEDE
jgi:hypothetical protein